jgi:FtsP/CotA-like multicopper oxidase with cupredoxin domain
MRTITRAVLACAAFAAALALAACGGSDGAATAAQTATSGATGGADTTGGTDTTTAPAKTMTIQVASGEAVGGTQTLTVKKGDHVRIEVTVDAPQELHLHGYNIELEAKPGTPSVFDFTARYDGIFDLESHLKDAKLVKLVVEP